MFKIYCCFVARCKFGNGCHPGYELSFALALLLEAKFSYLEKHVHFLIYVAVVARQDIDLAMISVLAVN